MKYFYLINLILLLLCGCIAYPEDYAGRLVKRRQTEYHSDGGCIPNPFLFNLDPESWQRWERINYNISCTRYQAY